MQFLQKHAGATTFRQFQSTSASNILKRAPKLLKILRLLLLFKALFAVHSEAVLDVEVYAGEGSFPPQASEIVKTGI